MGFRPKPSSTKADREEHNRKERVRYHSMTPEEKAEYLAKRTIARNEKKKKNPQEWRQRQKIWNKTYYKKIRQTLVEAEQARKLLKAEISSLSPAVKKLFAGIDMPSTIISNNKIPITTKNKIGDQNIQSDKMPEYNLSIVNFDSEQNEPIDLSYKKNPMIINDNKSLDENVTEKYLQTNNNLFRSSEISSESVAVPQITNYEINSIKNYDCPILFGRENPAQHINQIKVDVPNLLATTAIHNVHSMTPTMQSNTYCVIPENSRAQSNPSTMANCSAPTYLSFSNSQPYYQQQTNFMNPSTVTLYAPSNIVKCDTGTHSATHLSNRDLIDKNHNYHITNLTAELEQTNPSDEAEAQNCINC